MRESTSSDCSSPNCAVHGVNIRRRSTGGAVSFGDTADLCTETDDVDVQTIWAQSWKHGKLLMAGGLAGSIGKSFTAPLSRLTILFQVHSMVSTKHNDMYSRTMRGAIQKVLEREGFMAFWKGNGTSVIHRFPYSAVNFLTYESVKTALVTSNEEFADSMFTRFISGAVAGAVATSSCYPLDLIRTRLATQLDTPIHYHGISHAFHKIKSQEGVKGLYRGLGTTLCVTVPNLAINFTLYETLKEELLEYRQGRSPLEDEDVKLSIPDALGCGAGAGIMSSLITFPVDVVRRRLQIQGLHASGPTLSPLQISASLLREQGVRGFYRGLTPELLKVVPMVGITFGCFEHLKQLFGVDRNE